MIYVILALLVFAVNIAPALMPPTWTILAFFYINFELSLAPTVFIGATAATSGRIVLSLLARLVLRHVFSRKMLQNYGALGEYFGKHQRLTVPVVVGYAFLPIPSNQLFIIAGLARLDLKIIAFSFFFGRLISYTFWVAIANKVVDELDVIFRKHFTSTEAIVVQLIGFAILIIIGEIDWRRVLKLGNSGDR